MIHYKFLWIDDDIITLNGKLEKDPNKIFFYKFCEELNLTFNNYKEGEDAKESILWRFANTIGDGNTFLDNERFDFVLVDIHFAKENNFTIDSLHKKLNSKRIPYVIVSSRSSDHKKDYDLARHFYCLDQVSKNVQNIQRLLYVIENCLLLPSIKIMQVSDLHFGLEKSDNYLEEQKKVFETLFKFVSDEVDKIDVLCLNGDYCVGQPQEELSNVSPLIINLIKGTVGLDSLNRVMIIPGNHDMYWDSFLEKKVG